MGDIWLTAHPESFQLDLDTNRIFVNLPEAHSIAVVDRVSQKPIGKWPIADRGANFPMVLDSFRRQVLAVFRAPLELGVFAMTDGKLVATAETCVDADDLFIDAKRKLVYVSCGAGFVDVLEFDAAPYRRIARIPTVSGHAPRCSYPSWIVCCLPSAQALGSHRRSGCSANTLS
jgi:hypothetical protein